MYCIYWYCRFDLLQLRNVFNAKIAVTFILWILWILWIWWVDITPVMYIRHILDIHQPIQNTDYFVLIISCSEILVKVFDPDLNDELHCAIDDAFNYSDASLSQVTKPFTIQDATKQVLLNFDVQSGMKGYFTVGVTVEDSGTVFLSFHHSFHQIISLHLNQTIMDLLAFIAGHSTPDHIKIFIVTRENQISFKFNNSESQIQKNRSKVSFYTLETCYYSY